MLAAHARSRTGMAKSTRLGELERAVMDHLWSSPEPQTVRQVHEVLCSLAGARR